MEVSVSGIFKTTSVYKLLTLFLASVPSMFQRCFFARRETGKTIFTTSITHSVNNSDGNGVTKNNTSVIGIHSYHVNLLKTVIVI